MYLIAHRGNVSGPNKEYENSPGYILNAIELGYDVEVDVWYKNNCFYFGHDKPTYKVDKFFIERIKQKSWFHCKNAQCLTALNKEFFNINYFWHEGDRYALTSQRYVWAFPGEEILENSIILFPENLSKEYLSSIKYAGICSDYVSLYLPILYS